MIRPNSISIWIVRPFMRAIDRAIKKHSEALTEIHWSSCHQRLTIYVSHTIFIASHWTILALFNHFVIG